MTGKKIAGIIVLVVDAALGVAAVQVIQEGGSASNITAIVLLALLGIYLLVSKTKTKEEKAQKKLETPLLYVPHTAGLPIAEGTPSSIRVMPDHILVEAAGNTFTLKNEKITDIAIKTDVEIQKNYVSSAGGAVAGAVLFGALGAIVGGRAKQKQTTTATSYLIITYTKDGAPDYIGFEIPAHQLASARKLMRNVKEQLTGHTVNIEL